MYGKFKYEKNEKRAWMGYPHLVDYLPLWAIQLLLVFFLPLIYAVIMYNCGHFSSVNLIAFWIVCGWLFFFNIGLIIYLRSKVQYFLTTKRLIVEDPYVENKEVIVELAEVQEFILTQNLFQYLFRVGTINVVTTNADFPSGPLFRSVSHYRELFKFLEKLREILIAQKEKEEERERQRLAKEEEERREKYRETMASSRRWKGGSFTTKTDTPKLAVRKRN